VLGTTGIVRPYCRRAMEDAIRSAFDVAAACGIVAPILVPGNIGAAAAERHCVAGEQQVIEVGNDWGFALDQVAGRRFQSILLVGHPGKLAKLIRGDWDTHSSRSAQAVDLVAEMAAEVLPSSAVASEALPREALPRENLPSETVEGLFGSLGPQQRKRLGDETARRIRSVVQTRIDSVVPVGVLLIDMAGDCLGTSGGLTPWQ
ncbi:hypothetical protein LCGC14_2678520, partial [marine sediment metagenome]